MNRQTPLAPSTRRSRRAAIPWVIAGLSLAIAIAALYRPFSRAPTASAAPAMQAFIDFPNAWLVDPMLSPDGRYLSLCRVLWAGGQEGTILVRRLADGQATWLAGTEHALPLAWSPDSRSLAVIADGEIKAVDIAHGRCSDNRTGTALMWRARRCRLERREHPARRATAAPDVGRGWSCRQTFIPSILEFPSSIFPSFPA